MSWEELIDRKRERLLGILAMLLAVIDLDGRPAPSTLPRCTHNYVLRILRPAESAIRRLIVIAAWKVVPPAGVPRARERPVPLPPGKVKGKHAQKAREEKATGETNPAFPLFDPLKSFTVHRRRRSTWIPRISTLGFSSPRPIPVKPVPGPGDPVGAQGLLRRLRAASHALNTLDAQARRLARWRARLALPRPGPQRIVVLRPGYPPGRRKRPIHEIDVVLADLQALALLAMRPDSS